MALDPETNYEDYASLKKEETEYRDASDYKAEKKSGPGVQDLYTAITGDSRGLGKLLARIPGLSGYMERDQRRDADQLLRNTISSRLGEIRIELSSVQQALAGDMSRAIKYAESLGRADNLMMGLASKIKDAPQGYAGFFDAIKVSAEDLARLYDFDGQMLNHTDQIASDTAALQEAAATDADLTPTINDLTQNLRDANQVFNSRQEVLNKVK